jgi:GTP-binding protein
MPRRIDRAEFVISAAGPRDLPHDRRPEVVMVGRSNVGKSTLINSLVRKDIARTSATPGKTRLVNVYRIQQAPADPFYLVDLPGYGHASGGEKAREEFATLIGAYFDARTGGGPPSPLAGCILAIDSRHPGLQSDVDAWRWLTALDVPSLLAATKTDKLSQSAKARLRRDCEAAFGQTPLIVSALDGDGLDELWKRIREWTKQDPLLGSHS